MNAIDRDDAEKKIAEIREALEKATPGPWTKFENRIYGKAQPAVEPIICEFYEEETERDRNNAHLIANAPEWLRFLLSKLDRRDEENRRLRQERNKLIEALRLYADSRNWAGDVFAPPEGIPPEVDDGGQRARDILKECGVTAE